MTTQPQEIMQTPVKHTLNKWALASLISLIGGIFLILLIGICYTAFIVLADPIAGTQTGWNVIAFVILPFVALQQYLVLTAIPSLGFAIASLVTAKGKRNVLGIVMTVISGLMALQLPGFFIYAASANSC